MSEQILWFAARSAGVITMLLLSAVASLGLVAASGRRSPAWPAFLTVEVHRSLALLSVVFLVVHIVTAVLDPYASLGVVAAVIPLASSYRPIPVALGVIAVDLVIALVVTSLIRDRVGQRVWRAVHWTAYGAWPLALLHGITAGSDAATPWMLAVDAMCLVAVGFALAARLMATRPDRRRLAQVVASVH
jgi:sulfoxide reductase heme-binding subunit YedZ